MQQFSAGNKTNSALISTNQLKFWIKIYLYKPETTWNSTEKLEDWCVIHF
jgi:hypothetical protein